MTKPKPEDRIIIILDTIRFKLVEIITEIDKGKEYLEKCKKRGKKMNKKQAKSYIALESECTEAMPGYQLWVRNDRARKGFLLVGAEFRNFVGSMVRNCVRLRWQTKEEKSRKNLGYGIELMRIWFENYAYDTLLGKTDHIKEMIKSGQIKYKKEGRSNYIRLDKTERDKEKK